MKKLGQGPRTARRAFVKVAQRLHRPSGRENAAEHAQHDERAVGTTGRRGDARCPGAKARYRETRPEKQTTGELRDDEGFRNVDARQVDDPRAPDFVCTVRGVGYRMGAGR